MKVCNKIMKVSFLKLKPVFYFNTTLIQQSTFNCQAATATTKNPAFDTDRPT